MPSKKFRITNLTCDACVKLSTMALKKISGVTNVTIDPTSGETDVMSDHELAPRDITEALKSVGKEIIIPE